MSIAFVSSEVSPDKWLPALRKALPDERFEAWPQIEDLDAVTVALVAAPPPGVLVQFPNLKLIQSLWMGVDGLLSDASLPRHVPIARLIDPGMVAAMSETVLARVLDWHRHHYRYRAQQAAAEWKPLPQRMASDRTVGILGLGTLGEHAAARLVGLGFNVIGWSRRRKSVEQIECFSGEDGLQAMLARTDALVCLLPLTDGTRGILNIGTLERMPPGGCLINVARGGHLVVEDLIAALDTGQLAHAYLDVFEPEPLPGDSPLWRHPQVTLTPHIAALTEPRTALAKVVGNLRRLANGEAPEALVDPAAGY